MKRPLSLHVEILKKKSLTRTHQNLTKIENVGLDLILTQ